MIHEVFCSHCPKAEIIQGYTIRLEGGPPAVLIIPEHLKRNCEGIPEGHQFAPYYATCVQNSSRGGQDQKTYP